MSKRSRRLERGEACLERAYSANTACLAGHRALWQCGTVLEEGLSYHANP